MKVTYKINQVILKAICYPRPHQKESIFDVNTLYQENSHFKYYKGCVILKYSEVTLRITRRGYLTLHLRHDIKQYLLDINRLIDSILTTFRKYCVKNIDRIHIEISNIQCSFNLDFGIRYHSLCLKLVKLEDIYNIFVKESRSIEFNWVKYSINLSNNWNLIKFVHKLNRSTYIIDQNLYGSSIYYEHNQINNFLEKVKEAVAIESLVI
jgi:hypothetical protein